MNKSILGVGIILLGSLALLIINVISNYSTGSEVDYYLVKETSEAAMTEALDETFTSIHGIPRIDKEIFMETFIKRFASNVADNREYKIGFYGLNEVPPMVNIKVDSTTILGVKAGTDEAEHSDITTSISQLVETRNAKSPSLKFEYNNPHSFIGKPVNANGNQIILDAKVK